MTDTVGCGVRFERIRRITGYLVGTTDRFNNAKRAEERDRVKHCSMDADLKNVGRGGAGVFGPGVSSSGASGVSSGAEVFPRAFSGAFPPSGAAETCPGEGTGEGFSEGGRIWKSW